MRRILLKRGMNTRRVLIVEDDPIICLELELVLAEAGWEICGAAYSQSKALHLAEGVRPPFAVVDVHLAPGDGFAVAKELARRYGTAVLFTTAHCDDIDALARTGAIACLPKPYQPNDVPVALEAVCDIKAGRLPGRFPDHMLALGARPLRAAANFAGPASSPLVGSRPCRARMGIVGR